MRDRHLLITGSGLVLLGLLGVALLSSGVIGAPRPGDTPVERGRWIFRTGRDPNGQPIAFTDGLVMRLSCARCHGPDGQGGRVTLMMQSFTTPDITWPVLTGEHRDQDGEGEHPPYTEEALKRAITEGVNPAGQRLDGRMPRWQMTDDELNDLLTYLQTLR